MKSRKNVVEYNGYKIVERDSEYSCYLYDIIRNDGIYAGYAFDVTHAKWMIDNKQTLI